MHPDAPKLLDDLVRAYDNIDHEIVWHVVQNEIPALVATMADLLREADVMDAREQE